MAATKTSADRNAADGKGFTADEKAAMRERAREEKRERGGKVDGEADLLAKIADMDPSDRAMAEAIHRIVKSAAPELESKTWYGMPAYARNGKVVCFFQAAAKFKARYATFGFSDEANVDDGAFFPTSFGLKKLSAADEKTIGELVKRAVS